MSLPGSLLSLVIAGVAVYGLGIPLAWLLPAPKGSPWSLRVAVAPLYSVAAAVTAATLLGLAGVALHAGQLAVLIGLAWLAAAWRSRSDWHLGREPKSAVGPVSIVGLAGLTWVVSLVGYGLYLPNRDFKNHAFWVAQVAYNRTADPSTILRASSLSPPSEGAFYPLGLHTLLGWALPSPDWNSIGVTAAAAVLITAISTPLALIAMARQWLPQSQILWWLAGLAAVFFPGLTGAFGFGSVTILAATALYPAALCLAWLWASKPTPALTIAVLGAGAGLLVLHLAEALALGLVAAVALAVTHHRQITRFGSAHWAALAAIGLGGLAAAALVLSRLGRLAAVAQLVGALERDDISPTPAVLGVFVGQPAGPPALGPVWAVLVAGGLWLAWRARLAAFPLVALMVPWALVVLAAAGWVPATLRLLTAPWYAQVGRITLLATASVALFGCLTLTRAIQPPVPSRGLAARPWVLWATRVAVVAVMLATVSTLVPDRRRDLAASLAGAGDTPQVAARLATQLRPGQTVLNLEGDGTANLFAAARVPVISGWVLPAEQPAGAHDIGWLVTRLLALDDPQVQAAMADLNVAYLAIGTTSMFWDPGIGYDLGQLMAQPQLRPALIGSDMVVLRYTAVG